MEWDLVESGLVEALRHSPESNTLGVKFHSGGEYEYANVSAEQYVKLQKAESIGKHLRKTFINQPHLFPFRRVK